MDEENKKYVNLPYLFRFFYPLLRENSTILLILVACYNKSRFLASWPQLPTCKPQSQGPQPGPVATAPQSRQHSTCSHTCWAWAGPGFSTSAHPPPITHRQLPFPAFPVLWLTWQGTGQERPPAPGLVSAGWLPQGQSPWPAEPTRGPT